MFSKRLHFFTLVHSYNNMISTSPIVTLDVYIGMFFVVALNYEFWKTISTSWFSVGQNMPASYVFHWTKYTCIYIYLINKKPLTVYLNDFTQETVSVIDKCNISYDHLDHCPKHCFRVSLFVDHCCVWPACFGNGMIQELWRANSTTAINVTATITRRIIWWIEPWSFTRFLEHTNDSEKIFKRL